jgi:hypothetical protein
MKQRPRIYYTESQKALMWERWQQAVCQWCHCGKSAHRHPSRKMSRSSEMNSAGMRGILQFEEHLFAGADAIISFLQYG